MSAALNGASPHKETGQRAFYGSAYGSALTGPRLDWGIPLNQDIEIRPARSMQVELAAFPVDVLAFIGIARADACFLANGLDRLPGWAAGLPP